MHQTRSATMPSAKTITPRAKTFSATQVDTQLASTVAGIASRVLLHPIDCVKTRYQHLRGRPGCVDSNANIFKFIAKEGVPGLYRGIFSAIAGVIPYSMLYMPSYELAQFQLGKRLGSKQLLGFRHILAGSIAGLCGSIVKVPMDVVKKRLQAGLYPNMSVALTSIANESNRRFLFSPMLQFYAGWRSSIIYDVPYNAVQFTVLENVKRELRKMRGKELGKLDNVLVGAITGMITSVLTEPLDVIKTRMMTQRLRTSSPGVTLYKGWVHCVQTIVKEEGSMALWKGTLPRLVWVGASSAIWYGTYQAARQSMMTRRQNEVKSPQHNRNLDKSR